MELDFIYIFLIFLFRNLDFAFFFTKFEINGNAGQWKSRNGYLKLGNGLSKSGNGYLKSGNSDLISEGMVI